MTAAVRFSTLHLAEDDRAGAWEAWNRRALVGVRCRTPDQRGLRAEELNLDLPAAGASGPSLGLARVRAGRHEAVRDDDLVESAPTGAAVVYAVLRGSTTFTGPRGGVRLDAGQALIVDGDAPFRRTFGTAFTELVITVPRAVWTARAEGSPAHPVALAGPAASRAAVLARYLGAATAPAVDGDAQPEAGTDVLRSVALDLVGDLTDASRPADRLALARLVIDQHLTEPRLGEGFLAERVGVSARQLSRLFAAAGTSVPATVTARRLARATALLRASDLPVAAVATRAGFSSATYFSRVFARELGQTPARYRAGHR